MPRLMYRLFAYLRAFAGKGIESIDESCFHVYKTGMHALHGQTQPLARGILKHHSAPAVMWRRVNLRYYDPVQNAATNLLRVHCSRPRALPAAY